MKKVCSCFLLLLAAFQLIAAGCQPANTLPGEDPAPLVVAPTQPPAVATAPPENTAPPDESGLPLPPLVLNGSQPQGTDVVAGELSYDPNTLLRIDAHRVGEPEEPGAGINAVEFRISSAAGQLLYMYVDYAPGYCAFGGGEPTCNAWPLVDGVFRWGEGGPPIEPGAYNGQAVFYLTPENGDGSGDGEEAWRFSFEIADP